MFTRLGNSWQVVKASAAVLSADKELVIFPILSGVLLVLVSAGFVVPLVASERLLELAEGPAGWALAFGFYLVSYFVIFFCNSALVGAALIRLRGGDPTVADGFRIAFGKAGTILGYAFIAATVGMILRQLQERAGLLGRLVVGLIGLAWNLATFLVVPVLVTENVGPVDAVKRSMALFKKTWGEQVIGNFGVGAITTLAVFLLILTFLPLAFLAAVSESTVAIAVTAGGFVLALVLISLVSATLSGIYTAAVYRFAAEGEVGSNFRPDMVQGAFRPK